MLRALATTIESFARGMERSRRPEDRKLAADFLAVLAPLLAKATLGESILRELERIERLFGHTWLLDPAPFEAAFEEWRAFRREYERWALAGMTVNERLEALGLLAEFEGARQSRDLIQARALLVRVHVDEPSIAGVLESF